MLSAGVASVAENQYLGPLHAALAKIMTREIYYFDDIQDGRGEFKLRRISHTDEPPELLLTAKSQ
jgi:hypothetical protein